jgi:hypothetical protein
VVSSQLQVSLDKSKIPLEILKKTKTTTKLTMIGDFFEHVKTSKKYL